VPVAWAIRAGEPDVFYPRMGTVVMEVLNEALERLMPRLLAQLDGETVRVLESSLVEVEGATRVVCADAPLWLVKTEPVPAEIPPPPPA
jgi:hypothetical protein